MRRRRRASGWRLRMRARPWFEVGSGVTGLALLLASAFLHLARAEEQTAALFPIAPVTAGAQTPDAAPSVPAVVPPALAAEIGQQPGDSGSSAGWRPATPVPRVTPPGGTRPTPVVTAVPPVRPSLSRPPQTRLPLPTETQPPPIINPPVTSPSVSVPEPTSTPDS